MGLDAVFAPAQKGRDDATRNSSNGGAVVLAPRKRAVSFVMREGATTRTQQVTGASCNLAQKDWAFVFVHLKGCTVCIIVLYLTDGHDMVQLNQEKLCQVAAFCRMLGVMYIICGDWNMTPEQAEAAGLP
eukprot:4546584-Karenia_brevis.AAC.1